MRTRPLTLSRTALETAARSSDTSAVRRRSSGAAAPEALFRWSLPKGRDFPYAFFYLIAVFAVAWFGGYVPGAIACLLTMVALPLAAAPGFRLAKLDPSRLICLSGVSLLVSAVAQAQRAARELCASQRELDRRVQSRTQDLAERWRLWNRKSRSTRKPNRNSRRSWSA